MEIEPSFGYEEKTKMSRPIPMKRKTKIPDRKKSVEPSRKVSRSAREMSELEGVPSLTYGEELEDVREAIEMKKRKPTSKKDLTKTPERVKESVSPTRRKTKTPGRTETKSKLYRASMEIELEPYDEKYLA